MDEQPKTITSIDQLVAYIIQWHQLGMAQAKHMLEMPEGFESEYTDEEGQTVKIDLTGDTLKAFRMGVLTGIDAFSQLPITYSEADVSSGEPANEPKSE
jgi:hypothetical protein